MNKKQLVKTISEHDVFADLSDIELESLENIVDCIFVDKDEVIFTVGNQPNYLYFVEDGSLTLYFPNNDSLNLTNGELIGELGLLNGDFRLGTLRAQEKSKLIKVCGTRLFKDEYIPASISIKIMRKLGKRVTNYFRASQDISTLEMIENGESDSIEFKSTLRWNTHAAKKDKAIEFAILKTIVAFLNTDGGRLFIGVSDDGNAIGLELDKFATNDKLMLHFTNLVKSKIGALYLKYIHTSIEIHQEKEIFRIDCLPASHPAYLLDENDDHFFIRTGPSTTKLRTSKVYDYIIDRFESKVVAIKKNEDEIYGL